ncbi:low-density lipoprotein receptor-like isoform X2 [Schistocerca cancellata]|uniref:low-density lipoprotein receptor-like isoform X2 n=1 Tax=Schistocerca cancellata TaxID=274614 RepID=UPI0021183A6A|nr:low-density lipoprotein receptor-like isoform X2 [Schistocerca cancellata]
MTHTMLNLLATVFCAYLAQSSAILTSSSPSILSTHWLIFPMQYSAITKNGTQGKIGASAIKFVGGYSHSNTVTCYGSSGQPYEGIPCDQENCVPLTWVCDGERDCDSGADEAHCGQRRCPSDKFECTVRGSVACLDKKQVCDGHVDCQDGSDERPAGGCPHRNCRGPGRIPCADRRGCITPNQQCDGRRDCRDGSDETGCQRCHSEFEFQCHNKRCVPQAWLCDGQADCEDGEDENYYNCREHFTLQRVIQPLLFAANL